MNKRFQVFVSSTYKDLIEFRQLVIKALMQVDAVPSGMEMFPAADEDAWSIIQRAIRNSDYYMVIIGGLYGSMDKTGISYTELEYDYANSLKKPVMAFLHSSTDKLPRGATETDPALWNKLQAFREKAKQRHCNYWSSEKDLVLHVLSSYAHLVADHPSPGWVRGDQAKTVEDMERLAFLERRVAEQDEELRKLRAQNDELGDPVILDGDAEIAVHLVAKHSYMEIPKEAKTTWNDLFILSCKAAHDYPAPYRISEFIAWKLRDAAGLPKAASEFHDIHKVTDEDFGMIELKFMSFGLLKIDHVTHTYTEGRNTQTGLMKLWKVTEKGTRVLFALNSLRRSGDANG